jgi:hypothetical protein
MLFVELNGAHCFSMISIPILTTKTSKIAKKKHKKNDLRS